ncbi:MAG: NAD(P)-dependent oxidoreductase [Parvularculaceae bacterium]
MRTRGDEGELSRASIAANFGDLHAPLSEAQAVVEAARCLYCYDAPCVRACPTAIDIPTFIHQIRTGNVDGSARTILSANIMGGTCARVCPTEVLCEEACVVNHTEDAPVKIGLLQRHSVDSLLAKGGPHPFRRAPDSGFRLAVIGAGPAGLSFAHRASMLGHHVTVFERDEKPGGLNEYGLAAYKMVDDFAQAEISFLLGLGGIEIRAGKALGEGLELADLLRDYDAVFIGVGLARPAPLDIPGRALPGVRDALDFIRDIRCAPDKASVKVGRSVVVIGGGNTAIDAAVQAQCLGAEQVTLVYRRGRTEMSATGWEQELAASSGVAFRLWSAPVAFKGEGALAAAEFAATRLVEGTLTLCEQRAQIPCDMALIAIGQTLGETLAAASGLAVKGGRIAVDANYRTSLPGVYAGGDCIGSGEDLTVQAVEDGKRAAIGLDRELRARGKGGRR